MSKWKSEQPNVIVFFTDQLRWDTTGAHGNPLELTPNFDKMAREGTHVFNAFTCNSVCGRAHSSKQTGPYPTTTGCFQKGITFPEEGSRTLAHYFNEAGYRSGHIGKRSLTGQDTESEEQRGGSQNRHTDHFLEHTSDEYHALLYVNDHNLVKHPNYSVDVITDTAIRYIDRYQNDPFFLFLSYLEQHHQNYQDDYPSPDIYRGRYSRWMSPDLFALDGSDQQHLEEYYGMVRRLDDALGRLMNALQRLDLDQRTIVLFTSVHVYHLKTRNAEYKRSCHGSSIRIPMVIQGPGFRRGGQLREPVSLIDVPPILLDTAGIEVPDDMQGRSILPLLRGEEDTWPRKMNVQMSESQVGRTIRTHLLYG